ncbi:MAG: hypothetical protein FJ216_00905 [Ignavibacteria bacterium]|nr:hypothetical protein [Ignavibacteria bacterium]
MINDKSIVNKKKTVVMKALFITISIIILLFISLNFPVSPDYGKETKSINLKADTIRKDFKYELGSIEEIYEGYNCNEIIDIYSEVIPKGFSIIKFRYYVIFSGLSEDITYNIIDKDIRNTIEGMKNGYITKLPDKIIPVFIFEKYDDYKNFSVSTFGVDENDISPFGFYKISKNIIVMRYVSWKGSIGHEVTHSLMLYDFPESPSWFEEGMASLNEKAVFKDGELTGQFSWRILSLRRAFDENTYTGLKELMNTNDEQFYGKKTSFYYAQAMYLLLYLQEQGLLKKYYKEFKETVNSDKTGIKQLEKITKKSLTEIDTDLIEYIKSFKQEWKK